MVPFMMLMASCDQGSDVASCFDHLEPTNGMEPLMTLLESCDTDTSINGITWPNRLCCTLFQIPWPNECNGAVDNSIGITWCWCQCHVLNDWKGHVASHFDHLQLTYAMVLFIMPLVSWCLHWHHMIKEVIALFFNHLDLINRMMSLTMPSVSWGAYTGANSITWWKESCHTLFQLPSPNEQNEAIGDTVIITCCLMQCQY